MVAVEGITSDAEKLVPTAETVRNWVRQAERDSGRRAEPTSVELAELKRLKTGGGEAR